MLRLRPPEIASSSLFRKDAIASCPSSAVCSSSLFLLRLVMFVISVSGINSINWTSRGESRVAFRCRDWSTAAVSRFSIDDISAFDFELQHRHKLVQSIVCLYNCPATNRIHRFTLLSTYTAWLRPRAKVTIDSRIWEIDWYQNEWPWPLFRGRLTSCQPLRYDRR